MTMTRTLQEGQIRTPASTAMPETTRQGVSFSPSHWLHGPVKTYPTTRPYVLVLDREPLREDWCRAKASTFECNRRALHQGRHARVRWDLGGWVRAVWGVRAAAEKTS
jgi:hypothetical protein